MQQAAKRLCRLSRKDDQWTQVSGRVALAECHSGLSTGKKSEQIPRTHSRDHKLVTCVVHPGSILSADKCTSSCRFGNSKPRRFEFADNAFHNLEFTNEGNGP